MKRINMCQLLSLVILIILTADCKSDENIFETTTAVSYTTVYYGTSSNKFYSAENDSKVVQFARINWSNLTADMANGQGQYLSAMANLLKIKPTQKSVFYALTKAKFSLLAPNPQTTPEQFLLNLKNEIAKL